MKGIHGALQNSFNIGLMPRVIDKFSNNCLSSYALGIALGIFTKFLVYGIITLLRQEKNISTRNTVLTKERIQKSSYPNIIREL